MEELGWILENFGKELIKRELKEGLKILEKYKDYSKNFITLKREIEDLISNKIEPERTPTLSEKPPPPVILKFEEDKTKLNEKLGLTQEILNKTKELIMKYQKYLDEYIATEGQYIQYFQNILNQI